MDTLLQECRKETQRAAMTSGLVLGDRTCLTMARILEVTAVTADHTWAHIVGRPPIDLTR